MPTTCNRAMRAWLKPAALAMRQAARSGELGFRTLRDVLSAYQVEAGRARRMGRVMRVPRHYQLPTIDAVAARYALRFGNITTADLKQYLALVGATAR